MAGIARTPLPVLFADPGDLLQSALDAFSISPPPHATFLALEDYGVNVALARDAAAICTDSVDEQVESCVIGTPCVAVRPCTEHEATLDVGATRLVAANSAAIGGALAEAIGSAGGWRVPKRWDKAVSGRVVRALKRGIIPLH
jgi:UDP-N-acetylglucosamine 2-epimerase